MLLPTQRLITWTLLAGGAAAVLVALGGTGVPAGSALGGLLALLVAADAARGRARLAGISAAAPPLTRIQKGRDAEIGLTVSNPGMTPLPVRLALELPAGFTAARESIRIDLPAAAAARVRWSCTPGERGQFRLERMHLEADTALGFWSVRAALPCAGEIRVYPNLMDERRNVAALFLNRGREGMHAHRGGGKGREFEKLREYVAGDAVEDIHWRATAKRGHPVTKLFQIERTQEVYVLIDGSRLSARCWGAEGEPGRPAFERFVNAALLLGLAAERQGDLYGILTFSDRVDRFVRARNGKAHYLACREALYRAQPRRVTPAFDELGVFIRTRLRKRSLLVVLTALDDPALAEAFVRGIDLVSCQHLVVVNVLQAPEIAPLFTGDPVASADQLYARLGGHLRWREFAELRKRLGQRGVKLDALADERLVAGLVTQYLDIKARQVL